MPTIEIPGVGVVEFPYSMGPDEVSAAAKRLYDQSGSARPAPNTVSPAPYSGAPDYPVEDAGLMDPLNWLPATRGAQAVPSVARAMASNPGVKAVGTGLGALGQAFGRRVAGRETFDDMAGKLLETFGRKLPQAVAAEVPARAAPSLARQRAWARPIVGQESNIERRAARLAAPKDPAVAERLAAAKAEGRTLVSEHTRAVPQRAAAAKEPVPPMPKPGRVPIKVPGKPGASRAASQRGVSGPTIARRGVQRARVAEATKRPLSGNMSDLLEQSASLAQHMKRLGFSPAEKEAVWRALRAGG